MFDDLELNLLLDYLQQRHDFFYHHAAKCFNIVDCNLAHKAMVGIYEEQGWFHLLCWAMSEESLEALRIGANFFRMVDLRYGALKRLGGTS